MLVPRNTLFCQLLKTLGHIKNMKSLREQLIDIKKTLFGNDKCISEKSSIKNKDKISEDKLNKKDYIQCPICKIMLNIKT